jgi:hypothetical protein
VIALFTQDYSDKRRLPPCVNLLARSGLPSEVVQGSSQRLDSFRYGANGWETEGCADWLLFWNFNLL